MKRKINLFVLSLITLTAVLFTACDKNNPPPAPVVNCDNFEVTIQMQGNTNLVATPANGTSPYTYIWADSTTNNSITIDPANANTFSVTVTDANGCTASNTFEITIDPCDSFYANVSQSDSTGQLFATPTGGASPFAYIWSTNETTDYIFPAADGTYSVTITDANGCTAESSFNFVLNPCANTDLAVTISFNSDPSGNILIATATGGVSPYSYSWTDGATGISTSAISGTTYGLTITDANGCTVTAEYTVTAGCTGFLVDIVRNDSITTNIHFDAVTTAGTAPFSYEWGGFGSGTASFVDLTTGTSGPISVTVTDTNGCIASDSDQF